MMVAVFLMQPLGQILGAAVGWGALVSFGHSRGLVTSPNSSLTEGQRMEVYSAIDSIWRCVIGIGAFPALLATLWRFSIPESPRYTMDVDRDVKRAWVDVKRHHKKDYGQPPATNGQGDIPGGILINENNAAQTSGNHISKWLRKFGWTSSKKYKNYSKPEERQWSCGYKSRTNSHLQKVFI